MLTALAAELGSSQQRRKRTDGLSSSERKVSSPLLLPSIKVITNMFCVRTFSAEMRLNMVSAWYHGANDATLSIRNIGSHSLVTGEQGGNSMDFKNCPENCRKIAPKDFLKRTCG